MTAPVRRDWSKIKAYRAGTWPRKLPDAHVFGEVPPDPALPGLMLDAWKARYLAIDTEYHGPPGMKWDEIAPGQRLLDLVGVGWTQPDGRDVVLQAPWGDPSPWRTEFTVWLHKIVQHVPVVFQNAPADVPLLNAYCGIPFEAYARVDDLLLAHGVLWSEWPHDLEFLASVYSLYPKTKHLSQLDPLLYNRGDVADTVRCWAGVDRELVQDAMSARIYRTQSLPLLPAIIRRMGLGLKTNQEKIGEAKEALVLQKEAAAQLARAYTGVPDAGKSMLGSPLQLQRWLYDIEGFPEQKHKKTKQRTIDEEAMIVLRESVDPVPDFERETEEPLTVEEASQRIEAGAHPMLEARVLYAYAQHAMSHYLNPMEGRERVYPSIALQAQASGRWSITDPPIQQFPRPSTPIGRLIQASVEPDPGTVWIGWDWKSIEPRLEAYLSGEPKLIEVFESGGDIYKVCAACMGWPDPTNEQRQLAKRLKLKLSYGGKAKSELPGASALGLSRSDIEQAGRQFMSGMPILSAYWRRLQQQALTTRQVRTFDGRLRGLLGKTDKALREALNHPNQGGVAGILNATIIRIHSALPYALVAFTVHDAGWIEVPEDKAADAEAVIREIVTTEWELRPGLRVRFPADFKMRRASV